MTAPLRNHPSLRTLLLCALYAFVLLFFLSPDSYLRDLYYRCDSAIFFMCGKAWMNGMIPYVDFADSKGPLLWLIYGLGYLLNHHSYVGVFWISILFYTATLYIAYKLSRLFLEPRPAALCVALLPFVLFFFYWHFEVRAEDFCYPFVLFCLYTLCRVIKEEAIHRKTYIWLCIGMGISFMACLLMKWNIAAMIGCPMLCVFILSFKRKVWLLCLVSMVAGAVVLALPFVIYFLAFADIGAMIDEYFVNTLLTMHGKTNILDSLTFDRQMVIIEKLTFALLVGMLLFTWRYMRYFWLLLCYLIFRVGLGTAGVGWYYFAILTPFALFFIIAAVSFFFSKFPRLEGYTTAWTALAILLTIGGDILHVNAIFKDASVVRQEFYQAEYIMSQVEKPKIFWHTAYESGLGISAGSLPACRYWTRQNWATEEMDAAREEALRQRKPDFIPFFTKHPLEETDGHAKFTALGYVPYITMHNLSGDLNCTLYGRPGLKLPPEDFHVSQWDVWLKRNIFGI